MSIDPLRCREHRDGVQCARKPDHQGPCIFSLSDGRAAIMDARIEKFGRAKYQLADAPYADTDRGS